MKNTLDFDTSSYDISEDYDKTYFFLNNYFGEAKFIENLLIKRGILLDEARFMDLGCGTGSLIQALDPSIIKIGIDISDKMIKTAKSKKIENSVFIKGDLGKIDLPKNIDVIYLSTFLIQTFKTKNELVDFLQKAKENLSPRGFILFSWIDEERYTKNYSDGEFKSKINKEWEIEGVSKLNKDKKRYLRIRFSNNKGGSISSSAKYILFSIEVLKEIAKKSSLDLILFPKEEELFKESYQRWGALSLI